ncbi:MAG: hypothetical protein EA379_11990 [Phycisphaerales bacterium]|nr:MAG: hypothetical protein EA379_11990 [Phycisphaerales bacterium]
MSRAVRCARSLALLTVPLFQGALSAQISIDPASAGNVIGNDVFIEYASSSPSDRVKVFADNLANIGTIHVKVTGSYAVLDVEATGNLFSILKDPVSTGELRLRFVEVALDIGADSMTDRGVVEADHIFLIRADRNIYTDIFVSGVTEASSTYAINTIQVTFVNASADADGTLWGNVIAGSSNSLHRGRIGTINIANTIGGRQPTLIRAKQIDTITAGYLTTVDIDLLTFSNSPQRLGSIETTLGGWGGDVPKGNPPPGTLTDGGFLRAKEVTGDIDILENFGAEVTVLQGPISQLQWRIGHDFMEAGVMRFPDPVFNFNDQTFVDGLTHQILVNRNNNGGEWLGTVIVGTGSNEIELDGSMIADGAYTELASALGGGSIGVSPFRLHDSSCTPANGGGFFTRGLDINGPSFECINLDIDEVLLRFYGPIRKEGMHTNHVNVQKWDPILAEWTSYNANVTTTVIGPLNNQRVLRVRYTGSGPWLDFGEYRVVSIPGRLVCTSIVGEPEVVAFEYYFSVEDGCGRAGMLMAFDLNDDDDLCIADVAEWLINPVDFNEDSVADTADLSVLLQAIDDFE